MSKIQLKNATIESSFNKLNLVVDKGTSLAISGEQRSALLRVLAGFQRLDNGMYQLEYHRNETKDLTELAEVRREKMGFVSRTDDYLKELTVLENLELPFFFQSGSNQITAAKHQRLEQLSRLMGIHELLQEKANNLTNYEAKCLSIIRSCINSPSILLFEELAENLQEDEIVKLMTFIRLLKVEGITVIISTTNAYIISCCDQHIIMSELNN